MKPFLIELDGISKDKKFQIMRTALTSNGLSRNGIAEICGISSVTVGKVVSALLREKLLSAKKQSLGKGKNTELLYPSQRLKNLVLQLGKVKLSATLASFDGKALYYSTQAINESITYADNFASFCSELSLQIAPLLRDSVYEVALVVERDISASELFSCTYQAIPSLAPSAVFEYDNCTAEHICRYHGGEILLFIRITDVIRPLLVCRGTVIDSKNTCVTRCSENGDEVASHLSRVISSLFNVTVPDRIVISSETLLADKAFLALLSKKILRQSRIAPEYMPTLEADRKSSYATLCALEQLTEKSLRILSGID